MTIWFCKSPQFYHIEVCRRRAPLDWSSCQRELFSSNLIGFLKRYRTSSFWFINSITQEFRPFPVDSYLMTPHISIVSTGKKSKKCTSFKKVKFDNMDNISSVLFNILVVSRNKKLTFRNKKSCHYVASLSLHVRISFFVFFFRSLQVAHLIARNITIMR